MAALQHALRDGASSPSAANNGLSVRRERADSSVGECAVRCCGKGVWLNAVPHRPAAYV